MLRDQHTPPQAGLSCYFKQGVAILGFHGGKFTGSVDFPLCRCTTYVFVSSEHATFNNHIKINKKIHHCTVTLGSYKVRNVFGKPLLILEYGHPYL